MKVETIAAEGTSEGQVPGEAQKEEVRVPRPLAKDTWAATHGKGQPDNNMDLPKLVSSIVSTCCVMSVRDRNYTAALWLAYKDGVDHGTDSLYC